MLLYLEVRMSLTILNRKKKVIKFLKSLKKKFTLFLLDKGF